MKNRAKSDFILLIYNIYVFYNIYLFTSFV